MRLLLFNLATDADDPILGFATGWIGALAKRLIQFPIFTGFDLFLAASPSQSLDQSPEVVYAGASIPPKGAHFLIENFARIASHVAPAQLWILGKSDSKGNVGELLRLVKQVHLESRLQFLEGISRQDLVRRFASRRTVVPPSLSEGSVCQCFSIGAYIQNYAQILKEAQNTLQYRDRA